MRSPGSGHRTISSVVATLAILAVAAVAGASALRLFSHFSDGTQPVPLDWWLGLAIPLALLLVFKLLRQRAAPWRGSWLLGSVLRPIERLIEVSAFGTGALRSWTDANPSVSLDRIVAPGPLDEIGPPAQPSRPPRADIPSQPTVADPSSQPTNESARPASIPSDWENGVERHLVRRGETFWSLAEERLGDGRRWAELRDLNLGRTVAPGEVLVESGLLLAGWDIVLPKPIVDHEPERTTR